VIVTSHSGNIAVNLKDVKSITYHPSEGYYRSPSYVKVDGVIFFAVGGWNSNIYEWGANEQAKAYYIDMVEKWKKALEEE